MLDSRKAQAQRIVTGLLILGGLVGYVEWRNRSEGGGDLGGIFSPSTATASAGDASGRAPIPTCTVPPWSPEDVAHFRDATRSRTPDPSAAKTIAELAAGDDDTFVEEVHRRVFDKAISHGTAALSHPEMNMYLLRGLEGEMRSGGFHQYFASSSGNCASAALVAAREVSPDEMAPVYERAIALFPDASPSADRAERNAQIGRISDPFGAWRASDDAYDALKHAAAPLAAYLRAHRAALDLPARSP